MVVHPLHGCEAEELGGRGRRWWKQLRLVLFDEGGVHPCFGEGRVAKHALKERHVRGDANHLRVRSERAEVARSGGETMGDVE